MPDLDAGGESKNIILGTVMLTKRSPRLYHKRETVPGQQVGSRRGLRFTVHVPPIWSTFTTRVSLTVTIIDGVGDPSRASTLVAL